ncbi:hypothetical protein [Streptomyces sp. NPDC048611]|uniref:hypothetical protein n=1 Tax=Streptomyces sp. NPDC048611 TaxID=3155635 RepID=UPI003418069A
MNTDPTYEALFPGGECDGACSGCGAYVSMDQQQRHLAWHQWLTTQLDPAT